MVTHILRRNEKDGPTSDARSQRFAILVAGFAAVGGFLYGYDTGTISGILAMTSFKNTFGTVVAGQSVATLSTSETSLMVSILSAGTFFGALSGAPLADILGRRWGLQVALLVFCVGVALQTAATGLGVFVAGRAIAGLGVGIISTIVPLYQSECAPRWIRGTVVSCYQWAITIGLLISAVVNNGTKDLAGPPAYRIPIAIQIIFAAILSIGLLFMPESPRWFIKREQDDKAMAALAKLNSTTIEDPLVMAELTAIKANYHLELETGSGSYRDCFKRNSRKVLWRTLTGMSIQAWAQLTGINFIFYYGTSYFESTGQANPFLFVIASNVVNVVCTLPGMWGVERFGRRKILIWGALWMASCELIIAIIGTVYAGENPNAQRALVALVCIYVAGFASTWGCGVWCVTGEIFQLAVRAKSISLCTASNWLWNFAIGYATPYLVDEGPGSAGLKSRVFFIWAGTCFCAAIFAFFAIFETKGLSLEEVDELYATTSPLRSSRANAELQQTRQPISSGDNESDGYQHDKSGTVVDVVDA